MAAEVSSDRKLLALPSELVAELLQPASVRLLLKLLQLVPVFQPVRATQSVGVPVLLTLQPPYFSTVAIHPALPPVPRRLQVGSEAASLRVLVHQQQDGSMEATRASRRPVPPLQEPQASQQVSPRLPASQSAS